MGIEAVLLVSGLNHVAGGKMDSQVRVSPHSPWGTGQTITLCIASFQKQQPEFALLCAL